MNWYRLTLLTLAAMVFIGCGGPSSVPVSVNESSQVIYVSIPPFQQIAQEIAGDSFEVRSIVGEGNDPHSFSPSAKQLIEISQARAVFTIGMPFLRNLETYLTETAPGLEMIDLQEGLMLMDAPECEEHGDHAHHDHGEEDVHTWLSPHLLERQIATMGTELERLAPDSANRISKLSAGVIDRFDVVDQTLAQQLAPLKGRAIYVHHPAFAYFAEHYGLRQESVEMGGRAPSAKRVAELIEKAKAEEVRVIFTQPQFDPSSAEKIAEAINGAVVIVDPLAPDLFENFKTIGSAVSDALSP